MNENWMFKTIEKYTSSPFWTSNERRLQCKNQQTTAGLDVDTGHHETKTTTKANLTNNKDPTDQEKIVQAKQRGPKGRV